MEEDKTVPMKTDTEKLTLVSADDTKVEVDVEVAKLSKTISHLLTDINMDDDDNVLDLPNIETGEVLEKVVEYLNYEYKNPSDYPVDDTSSDNIREYVIKFLDVKQDMLFALTLAANYLDIKPLLDDTCKTIANMIKGKTPEEIKKTFNIKDDFTETEGDK